MRGNPLADRVTAVEQRASAATHVLQFDAGVGADAESCLVVCAASANNVLVQSRSITGASDTLTELQNGASEGIQSIQITSVRRRWFQITLPAAQAVTVIWLQSRSLRKTPTQGIKEVTA